MTKRIIALLLALILTVGLLPTVALATEGETPTTDNSVVTGKIVNGSWSQDAPTQPAVDGVKTVDKTAEKVAGTDNQYKVTLTVVLEQTEEEQKPGAAATVLVLDTSGSMAYCAECGESKDCEHSYKVFEGTANSSGEYFYKDNKGEYQKAYYCDGKDNKKHDAGWYKKKDHREKSKLINPTIYEKKNRISRLDAAKTAAQSFLKTYSGLQFDTDGKLVANQTARDLDRYVSVVTFATGVTLQKDWLDISDPANYTAVLNAITSNDLIADGGTNLDAGLTYAEYLLKQDTVKDAAKNVIALTDGEPTYYLSTSSGCNDQECDGVDNRPQIGEEFYYVHGRGDACSTDTKSATDNAANALKNNNFSDLYTVCFGVANDKMKQWMNRWDSNDVIYWNDLTVGQYLESLASKEEGKTFAYAASNANELNAAFAAITGTIVSGLNTGTVNDTLPTGITGSTATANGQAITSPMTWKLDDDFDVESTKTEGDKKVTTYTYTKTYYVTINPDARGLKTTKIGDDLYAPLNGETTLTVEVAGEEKNIPFPIPAGKVTPTTFTVTWKSQDGEQTYETDNNVVRNSQPSYEGEVPTKDADWQFTYTFEGWAESPNQESGKQASELSPVTDNVTYYAAFSKQLKQYTVTGTIDNGTVNNKASTDTQTVNAGGSSAAMTFTPAAGYKIISVKEKVGEVETTITDFAETGYTYPVKNDIRANITVDVKTAKRSDLKYVVKHVEKDNATNVLETENKTGTLDEVINGKAQKKTFTGFTYAECSPESIKISATEDNNVITLYYTRNKYKVTYTYTGSVPQGLQPPTETEYDFGASVTIANAPAAVPGYTFEGWKRDKADATDFTMPDGDVIITGNWTKNADAGYTIEYYLETLTEGTFEKDNNRTISDRTGTIGTTASVTDADKKQIAGFTFDENNTKNRLEGEIVSGNSLTLKLYYTRNSYTVKYQYTGTVPTGASTLPPEETYKYGAEVTVAANATAPDHDFSGWGTTDASINNGKFVMPAKNVTITGSWTLKEPTAVNVDLNNHIYKTFTSDTADIPNGKLTFNVTVSGKSDNAASMTQSGYVEFTRQDVENGTTSKAFTFASNPLTFTAAGEYTFEVVEDTTTTINGLTYNVGNGTHTFTIVVDKKANTNELEVKEVRVGTEEYTGVYLTDTLAYATITNNYIEPKKTFDLNNTIFKTFTPVAGGLPIPTGEGISYTFTARMTEQTEEGVADGNTGRNYILKATLTGEVTEANKVPFKVEGASEVSFAPGTYYFLVREDSSATVTGTVNGTIHNDSQAYLLTLTVNEDLSFETEVQETAVAMSLEESTPGLGTVTFNNTYEEKEPGKCTIDFSNFIRKELTKTGDRSFNGAEFTANVDGWRVHELEITMMRASAGFGFEPLTSVSLKAAFPADITFDADGKAYRAFTGDKLTVTEGEYLFLIDEINDGQTNITYDESKYWLELRLVEDVNGNVSLVAQRIRKFVEDDTNESVLELDESEWKDVPVATIYPVCFYNTIDTGRDDYIPIIIPTIINKDTGMLNKTDHFAYVIGYPDGTVHPNGQITRAEVATIFFRLLRDEVRDGAFTTSNSYSDVAYGKWYNNPISTMSALGIITGYPDGTFKPNKPITRAEFAAIAARFDETQSGKSATFSDVIGHWAAKEIGIAYYNDWIKGYPDGTFKPDQNITRAEAMTLINRVLERKPESPADLLTNMNKWTDNMDTSKWYYLDVQEATNSHGYTRKTFNYELWRQMLPDPDWSRYER